MGSGPKIDVNLGRPLFDGLDSLDGCCTPSPWTPSYLASPVPPAAQSNSTGDTSPPLPPLPTAASNSSFPPPLPTLLQAAKSSNPDAVAKESIVRKVTRATGDLSALGRGGKESRGDIANSPSTQGGGGVHLGVQLLADQSILRGRKSEETPRTRELGSDVSEQFRASPNGFATGDSAHSTRKSWTSEARAEFHGAGRRGGGACSKALEGMPTIRPAHLQAIRSNGRLLLRKVGPGEHTLWHPYNHHAGCDISSLIGAQSNGGGHGSGQVSRHKDQLSPKFRNRIPRAKKSVSADYSKERFSERKLTTVEEGVPAQESGRQLLPRSRSLPLETRHLSAEPAGPPRAIVKEMRGLLTAVANSMQQLKLFRRSIPEGDESRAEVMPGSNAHQQAASLWPTDRQMSSNPAAISCG